MPYFVYRIKQGPTVMIKDLELMTEFESFKEAKDFAKQARIDQADGEEAQIKVMFADNQLHAEEQLMEARDEPIVREWEK
ncbi:MAG: hypothetical protein PVG75_03400 [Thioalkalispiraceae bacterium]|jgi:hypothetical protein